MERRRWFCATSDLTACDPWAESCCETHGQRREGERRQRAQERRLCSRWCGAAGEQNQRCSSTAAHCVDVNCFNRVHRFVLLTLGRQTGPGSAFATFCPFPRKCVDLWVEGLNSQASTLASPWHVAYGFKNRLALREIFSLQTAWMLTNSSRGTGRTCD